MPRAQRLFTVFTHPQTTHIPIYSKHFKLGDINQPSSVNAIFDSPRPVTWRDTPRGVTHPGHLLPGRCV